MKILLAIGLVLYASVAISSSSAAQDDGDVQLWLIQSVEGDIGERWSVDAGQRFKFGDDVSHFINHRASFGVTYRALDWLHLSMNYNHIYSLKNDMWEEERRPHFNVKVKWRYHNHEYEYRNRMEYRFKGAGDQSWRYRGRLKLEFPFKLTEFSIRPYIADEIFIDFEVDELNRNRLYQGIKADLTDHLLADLYYLWQTSKDDTGWKDCHVVGVVMKVKF